MRNAFNAALERDDYDASRLDSSVGLDEDLQNIASLRAGTHTHVRCGSELVTQPRPQWHCR